MEYGGSGVTYNALPKYGGVPIRTREINEFAPGRVFYSTVDNIGNLKIGDFFAVNQLTGEVTIDANSFNLSGLNAIGPFKRNGVAAGVVLQEVSNNTTLLNSQGLYGEDTVPTQYAVKGYIDIRDGRLNNLETTSASVYTSVASLNTYTASLKTAIDVTGGNTRIIGNLIVDGTQTSLNTSETFIEDKFHGVVQDDGWVKHKLWIYHPEGDIKRSYHLDGREGTRKFTSDDQAWGLTE